MIFKMFEYENEMYSLGYKYIAGLDEAGRGPMAGPVVVACVVNPKDFYNPLINDSKKLSEKIREELYDVIMKNALYVVYEIIDNNEVDLLNPYAASKLGMINCVKKLPNCDCVLTDAMPISKEELNLPVTSIIKGDQKSFTIACSSIIAKVIRDRVMKEYSKVYPMYEFEKHKGYVTKKHLLLLQEYGITPIHRKSYAPVKKIIENL